MNVLEYEQVTHVIQVQRGHMRINYPFSKRGLKETDPLMVAHDAVAGMLRLQLAYPDRENPKPIDPWSKIPIVLKLPDRDDALHPEISLERQLEGKWQIVDAEKIKDLGEGAIHEMHGRCSFLVLELVDSLHAP